MEDSVRFNRWAGTLFAVTTGLCWAVLAIALRQATHFATSGTIVWFRMLTAFLFLLVVFQVRSPANLKILLHLPRRTIGAGLCLAANYFGYMKGVELTSAGNAQIMIQLGPLLLVVIGIVYFKEIPSRRQATGILAAVFGFGLFFWDQILQSITEADRYIEGNLWILMGALTWAAYAGLQKGSSAKYSPQQYNLLIYGLCAICLWPLARIADVHSWTPGVWILMIALGLNTVVAYGALAEALTRIPASHVSLIVSCNPLLTLFLVSTVGSLELSWIQYEPIGWRGWVGAAAVILGVIMTVFKKDRP